MAIAQRCSSRARKPSVRLAAQHDEEDDPREAEELQMELPEQLEEEPEHIAEAGSSYC